MLSENESLINFILEDTLTGYWLWDIECKKVYLSPGLKKRLGDDNTLLNNDEKSLIDLITPEDISGFNAKLDLHFKSNGTHPFSCDVRYRQKNNATLDMVCKGKVVEWTTPGIPKKMAGYLIDITEYKSSEKNHDNGEKFRTIFEASAHGILIADVENFKFTDANPSACKLFGYTRDEFLNMSVMDIHPEEAHENIHQTFKRLIAGDIDKSMILPCIGKNRKVFYSDINTSKISIRNKVYLAGFFIDVTEQQKAQDEIIVAKEMAEAASYSKSQFLATMSHEIRTPMNGIIGMIDLLQYTQLSMEQRSYAETVKECSVTLLRLLNDILDYSKIEAGKLDLEMINFNLHCLIEDVISSFAFKAHEKKLELICGIAPNLYSMFYGDPGRLRQILTNLISNAVKFTHEGQIVLRTIIEEDRVDSTTIRFNIRDTGIGIPEKHLNLLFNKFTQVDTSTTRKYGGTGLGLAICKQLVEMMSGEIGVQSQVDHGSEFWFRVTLKKERVVHLDQAVSSPSLSGLRVLIIDENSIDRTILHTQLELKNMMISETTNTLSALQEIYKSQNAKTPFQVVIFDNFLSETNLETLCRTIRSDPTLDELKLIIMTSNAKRGDAKRYESLGFNAFLPKPAHQSDVYSILETLFNSVNKTENNKQNQIITRHTIREQKSLMTFDFSNRKKKILLVEDNFTNQAVALGMLKKLGIFGQAVSNGKEALTKLESQRFDLILMDIQMPIMNGFEATKAIRNFTTETSDRNIPIIAMTADALAGDREKCLREGMNDYLSKPVNPHSLAAILWKWLPQNEI
jgi:PAS domain S-box-containing protein